MQTPAVIPSSTSGGQGDFTDEGHVSKRTRLKEGFLDGQKDVIIEEIQN